MNGHFHDLALLLLERWFLIFSLIEFNVFGVFRVELVQEVEFGKAAVYTRMKLSVSDLVNELNRGSWLIIQFHPVVEAFPVQNEDLKLLRRAFLWMFDHKSRWVHLVALSVSQDRFTDSDVA